MDNIKSEIEHAIAVLNKVKKVYSNLEHSNSVYFKPGDMLYGYKSGMPIAALIQATKELQRVLDNPNCLAEYGSLK